MSTLYDLQGKYASLLELAEDGTTDPEVLADTMDSIVDAINDKAEGYAQVIRQIKADIEANKKNVTVSKHGLKLINLTSVLFHSGWLKQ
ncbi:hypothetical protein Lpp126_18802 [Lacticaseibacillus paracasei subsp. paracasei Lpp126]|uniref:Phage protein n=1 Tax=Lacticaseibacillus paracasei subsp. paracasei Lpp126 TaxID=1256206 RepID=S2QRZ9_LACPA|nr:hypothetical protein Lpp126_18802 [Lacticaseibacillus paracasei subsp. paracasei Lpp126]